MTQNNRIDLTAPEFEGNQQAQDLIQLQQHFKTLDNFFARSSLNNYARLTGVLESLNAKLEQMEEELLEQVRQAAAQQTFAEQTISDEYHNMSTQQRAAFLLSLGITAKIDLDPDALELGYSAWAGAIKIPLGYYSSEEKAIRAATEFLEGHVQENEYQMQSDDNG